MNWVLLGLPVHLAGCEENAVSDMGFGGETEDSTDAGGLHYLAGCGVQGIANGDPDTVVSSVRVEFDTGRDVQDIGLRTEDSQTD